MNRPDGDQWDTVGLNAAARYLDRLGTEEGKGYATIVRKCIISHARLADRYVEDMAELRGKLGDLSGRS